VRTAKGKKLGRLNLETLEGLEGWTPPKDLVNIVVELKREGRL
jgi:hypothetical protein